MKIKKIISDQFLWDVFYPFFSSSNNILEYLSSNKYKQINMIFGNENTVIKKYRKDKNRKKFENIIYYLKKNNYIKIENLKGKEAICITKKGLNKIIKARFKVEDIKFNKRKDGKWIMIIFDIPQKHNKARGLLRSILKNLGYKMFQQSVWVTPYDVSEKTEELLQWYSLDKYVRLFFIEKI